MSLQKDYDKANKEFQDSMNALEGSKVVNGVIMTVDLNANLNGESS